MPVRASSVIRSAAVLLVLIVFTLPVLHFASRWVAVKLVAVLLLGLASGLFIRYLVRRSSSTAAVELLRSASLRIKTGRRYVVPAELPPPPGLLIGRDRELDRMRSLLVASAAKRAGAQLIAITGVEGVGKSALAITAAHLASDQFPDGQVLVRFDTQRDDGTKFARVHIADALSRPGENPPGARMWRRWYQARTSHKRILVVLDNVNESVDVASFIPAGRESVVVVTSRKNYETLASFTPVPLEPLAPEPSKLLFESLLGDPVSDVDSAYVDRVIAAAAGFPAALQMAGAVLRARRSWDLEMAFKSVEQLPQNAPQETDAPFQGVLDLAFALLTDQERRCLGLLGLLNTRRVAPWMLVALVAGAYPDWAEFDEVAAGRVFERLTRSRFTEHRVDERSGVAVYRVPSYVRGYAETRLRALIQPEQVDAAKAEFARESGVRLTRNPEQIVRHRTYRLLDDGKLDAALEAAREALSLVQDRARSVQRSTAEDHVLQNDRALAEAAFAEVNAELGWIDEALTSASSAESHSTEPLSRIRALRVQGRVRWRLRQDEAAIEKLSEANDLAMKANDDPRERIRVLRELTVACAIGSQRQRALDYAAEAVQLCQADASTRSRRLPSVLWAYGLALTTNGEYAQADITLDEADTLSGIDSLEQGLWRSWIRHQRAVLAFKQDDFDSARDHASKALDGFTANIHRYGSGHCRLVIGQAYLKERRFAQAVSNLEEAVGTFGRCGDRWVEAASSYWLAQAYAGRGDSGVGVTSLLYNAVDMFVALGDHQSGGRAFAALRDFETKDSGIRQRLGRRFERHASDDARILA